MSNAKRRLPFVQLDVFTPAVLEGNPLAVFTNATGLSDQEMQALTREMNLSETTFILPRDAATERERGVRVRIFNVVEEMPFAGHPTLGTAMAIRGDSEAEEICLDLNVGKIPVRFSTRDGLPFGLMTQKDPQFGQTHAREAVARAAGITEQDIAGDLPIQTVSTGNAFAIVPIASLKALENLAPLWPTMKEYLSKTDARYFYFVSREALNPGAALQARMIFPGGEDPATGSAAGPCIAWAVRYGVIASGVQVLLEQGVEIKRRSQIYVSAEKQGNEIVNVRVGGHAVTVMQGEVLL
ncbi:MAG TPA: PhzF family phenazine biosynthesis protein [Candidatus Angelobacter sp.]|nr:PhzF family phenazine biosynthesis protein [Candidatus Angelobacter sp.]